MLGLIDPAICRGIGQVYGSPNSVLLKEHDAGATLKELVLTNLPPASVIADLDPVAGIGKGKRVRLKRYSWFFDEGHQLASKQCDGAVHVLDGGVDYIYLIELKSSLSGLAKGRRQLEAGEAFVSYIRALAGKDIKVRRRLVYVGPLVKPVSIATSKGAVRDHEEIPVSVQNGRAFISFSRFKSP